MDGMNKDVDARKNKKVRVAEEKINNKDLNGIFNEVSSIAVNSSAADDNDYNDIRSMLQNQVQ